MRIFVGEDYYKTTWRVKGTTQYQNLTVQQEDECHLVELLKWSKSENEQYPVNLDPDHVIDWDDAMEQIEAALDDLIANHREPSGRLCNRSGPHV